VAEVGGEVGIVFGDDGADGVLLVHLCGELDIATVAAVREHVLARMLADRAQQVVVSLEGLRYFGAAGVTMIGDLRRRSAAEVTVRCGSNTLARVVCDLGGL
jgi:anti-anti-sigma factor